MKEVWIVGWRNDRYCERYMELYSTEAKARKCFNKEVRDRKDKHDFEYEKGDNEAIWYDGGDFCSVSIWKEEVK